MIAITGIGWITIKEYGCVLKKLQWDYPDMKSLYSCLQQESVFLSPVKNFGRFDRVSKLTCLTAALALHDAGIPYSKDRKQDIGILGTNIAGCLQSNVRYFKDYVESGRTLARGNLFIYTLPSTPFAEAAIYFGFQGPLLYMAFPHHGAGTLLRCAWNMIERRETPAMMAMIADETEAVCFSLAQQDDVSSSDKVWKFDDALNSIGEMFCIEEIVNKCIETVSCKGGY